jgi:hypothetical protein
MTLHSAALLALLIVAPALLRSATPPAWVQQGGADPGTYPPSRYLTGYGLSSPGGTDAEQRQQAIGMAQEAIAASIRTHVTSAFTSSVTQRDKVMSRFAQNLVSTRAEVELDGLDTIVVWPDPKGKVTHALAVLDKPRTLMLLGDKLGRQARECAAAFKNGKAASSTAALLKARHLRERIDQGLLVQAVLGAPVAPVPGPDQADIDGELRRVYGGRKGLDGFVAMAALDLGATLPRGIRVFMDAVTYADTPFRGSLSAYLEQALASELVACGQVTIVDKAAGREAIRAGGMEANLAATLRSQAVVRGACFDLGEAVQFTLRVTAVSGEELAAASFKVPAAVIRKAGLKLVPDNFEEARKALALCDATVKASRLQVKLALDRGDGGIYRQGDKLYLFLRANLDCYVKVLYHQVDGSTVVIFPNAYHPDGHVVKDRQYQIPPDDNSFALEVMEPFGVELVKVMASTEPLDPPGPKAAPGGLQVAREDLATLLGRTRGIGLKKAEAQYAETTVVVNTLAGMK